MNPGVIDIILAAIAIVGPPVTAWLTSVLMRNRSAQEIAKLKTEVDQMRADVRSRELDNDRKAIETMMELVVNPLRREMSSLRSYVNKLTHAIEKIPACPYSDTCPVSRELQRDAAEPGVLEPDRDKGPVRRRGKPAGKGLPPRNGRPGPYGGPAEKDRPDGPGADDDGNGDL